MCIEPKDEAKFAEDLRLSEGLVTEKYNNCLYEAQKAKTDPKKCEDIHPFSFRGLQLPKTDEACEKDFPVPANLDNQRSLNYKYQVMKLCAVEPSKVPVDRKCVLKQLPKGGFNDPNYNLGEAALQCDPLFKECKKSAEGPSPRAARRKKWSSWTRSVA